MTAEIERFSQKDASEWDALVSESDGGTLPHRWEWLRIIERHTASTLHPLVIRRDGAPIGIIPLFFQKHGVFRMVFSPPPSTSVFYLGPLVLNYGTLAQEKRECNYFDMMNLVGQYMATELRPDFTTLSLIPASTTFAPSRGPGIRLNRVTTT